MTEYEEYEQTNMLGSYQPERALLRKTDDGVSPCSVTRRTTMTKTLSLWSAT